ncbi:YXWGXW repeat-containing protein [Paraburkholderia sp. Ac-20342]|uniref:YXWGXW repeat-containing protein n=1 Tax=Paraburkholderia sp. Ac-20342 TaxID=2703889 RepID=UPI0032162B5E
MVAAGACAVAIPAVAEEVIVVEPGIAPPPERVEVLPAPRVGYVWHKGHWSWDHGQYVWVAGYWQPERIGYHWVPGHWIENGPNWHWVKGYWAN